MYIPRLPTDVFLDYQQKRINPNRVWEIFGDWNWIVGDYTRRNLTYSSEKPIAIAAVAELFSKALKSRYVAGLWEVHLIHQLTWFTTLIPRALTMSGAKLVVDVCHWRIQLRDNVLDPIQM